MNKLPPYVVITYIVEGTGLQHLGYAERQAMPGDLFITRASKADILEMEIHQQKSVQVLRYIYLDCGKDKAVPHLPMKWSVNQSYRNEFIQFFKATYSFYGKPVSYAENRLLEAWKYFTDFLLSKPMKASLVEFENSGDPLYKPLHHIACQFKDSVSVHHISKQLHMSTRHFQRNFKNLTGKSYKQLLMETRIRHSCGLLSYSTISIEKIANLVGIHDMYHFYQLFHQYCGMTPGAFRKLTY
ncbi:helix-turn-helix transcriptional regulator [Paenibacillus sp. DMB5]|uniref:helix-turn-helix transcriptional regulator n=1 Tax=Paenibacillus sp. DMB5 TaxID=1780103 RepID=UPI00076D5AB3|nr:helix-turn-helix transcriptional regulator [Paenibacillus sp. DMB5]KUP21813.1 hypothetical protein AWJ19_02445 [Paenibacillus sp. DMB5]